MYFVVLTLQLPASSVQAPLLRVVKKAKSCWCRTLGNTQHACQAKPARALKPCGQGLSLQTQQNNTYRPGPAKHDHQRRALAERARKRTRARARRATTSHKETSCAQATAQLQGTDAEPQTLGAPDASHSPAGLGSQRRKPRAATHWRRAKGSAPCRSVSKKNRWCRLHGACQAADRLAQLVSPHAPARHSFHTHTAFVTVQRARPQARTQRSCAAAALARLPGPA